MNCLYCGQPLAWVRERGYVHLDGGGSYMMRCPDCGWQGAPYPSPVSCPQCGCKNVRDDHCAAPSHS